MQNELEYFDILDSQEMSVTLVGRTPKHLVDSRSGECK